LDKPCVVVAGAREGVRWQLNPGHQFLYRNGAMKCAPYDGCWRSKIDECDFKAESGQPMCLELIEPHEVARAIRLYYLGGRLTAEKKREKPLMEIKPKDKVVEERRNSSSDRRSTAYYYENGGVVSLDPLTFFRHKHGHSISNSTIFNVLRTLKKINPDDGYLEAYYWHYNKRRDVFTDLYHFLWWVGANYPPKRILEIGTRTGVSICQLLSSMMFYEDIEKIVLCDNFSEIGSPEIVMRNLDYLNIPTDKIEFIVGDSLVEIPKLIKPTEGFDYILVDGCHDKPYATQDLANVTELIKMNGYIVMDDIAPDGCSLQDVWDDFKVKYKDMFDFTETHCGKGLGVARRIK
ncbi:MAG: class I SAM-dependent methyltransferase, partial [Candidatus Aceula meridiana]|nr:class I SAM-dependent methyltransferase [Candidatus Aceula meridiana]